MTIPQAHIDKLCRNKHLYTSKKDAESRIKAKRKKGFLISPSLRIYKCSFCYGWHMGHQYEYDPEKKNPSNLSEEGEDEARVRIIY